MEKNRISAEKALKSLLHEAALIARRYGLRATPSGIMEGMGFSYETPFIIAYGLAMRGLIDGDYRVTEEGRRFLEAAVRLALDIRDRSLFPELDRGKLVGAVIYALYDWLDEYRDAKSYMIYVEEVVRRVERLKDSKPQAFETLAVLLPRIGYEDRYSPLQLVEALERDS